MAKWGQGDPRWIVEEREDGTNVNNWHCLGMWIPAGASIHGSSFLVPGRTERDATSLSKGKLRDLLVGIVVENETGHRMISELKQVEESGAKHKGLIEILSLSEENEVDDTEMNVSKKKGDGDIRKDLMKTAGTAKVREALGDYMKALKTGFSCSFHASGRYSVEYEDILLSFGTSTLLEIQASSPTGLGVRIPTVTLHMTELFDPTVEQLYSIFTVKDKLKKEGHSKCLMGTSPANM
ncbi:Hypothetical predicted protein [Lynx pardinus]|uniref:Activator of Hsp90 ATPase AHSA1-like N-terminal domain-containing protein n=1 Tax=Lynx pardinus TaxID=191816 RepID=A0A485NTU1_LYNPA|nr:Hypothetical predicted protein [Lynx pardinus]